ncbi:MAG TPA: SOS response-associated peptidase [Solirubrobacteraceae bacterium]|nr:SOS response-associated peptidase [Solirubrobacteraceae bacterium]
MCGRYTITTNVGRTITDRFGVAGDGPVPETLHRFNVCPTEPIAIVAGEDGSRRVRTVRWGLVPPWARALGKGFEPINARSETAATKSPFAALMERADRRCLVIADGWYEWLRSERKRSSEPRIPFRYTVDGGAPFAFAGLWDARRVAGERVDSATILTTSANAVCAPVHDRMPCVLAGPEEEAAWLSGELDAAALGELLVPLDAARCDALPANPAVNKAGVEGPELLAAPTARPAAQLELGL